MCESVTERGFKSAGVKSDPFTRSLNESTRTRVEKKKKKSLSFQLFYLKEPVSDAVLPVLPGNCLNIVTNLSTLPTRLVSKFLLMVQLIVLE